MNTYCEFCQTKDCDCIQINSIIANKLPNSVILICVRHYLDDVYRYFIIDYNLDVQYKHYSKEFILEINGEFHNMSYKHIVLYEEVSFSSALRFLEILKYGLRHELADV